MGHEWIQDHSYKDRTWWHRYAAERWLELIGRSRLPEDHGALVVYEIDNEAEYLGYCGENDHQERAAIQRAAALPFIVLAGE